MIHVLVSVLISIFFFYEISVLEIFFFFVCVDKFDSYKRKRGRKLGS